METGGWIAVTIVLSLLMFIGGWIGATFHCRKKIRENPAITEEQVRELHRQATGKKLSEKQVKQIMNSIKRHQ